jgi:branched-chain amino acid transport system ATP-binding protein
MLQVESLETSYGASQVLFGPSLEVGEGELVSLMGRNGMGKTTFLKSVLGLVRPRAGRITFRRQRVDGWPTHRIARLGIGFAPEDRQVFPLLSVEENLRAAARAPNGSAPAWTLQSVYAMFPRLRERASLAATALSGGEQQMLSIGRALMTNPVLLMLDEATEGLAPIVRAAIWSCIRSLKDSGLAILVVDKNLDELLALADRHYILEKGRIAWCGTSAELRADARVIEERLGV